MAKLVNINPLVLPPDYKELRKPKTVKRDTGEGNFNTFDLSQYDERTIFYDVFINKNGSKLIAIGPPFLNLGKFLNHLQLIANGGNLNYKITKLPKGLVQLSAELKKPGNEVYDISISFESYNWSRKIVPSYTEKSSPLVLTTLQKDNKTHWILDWIKYYENHFGVEQFIIYDNYSDYQQELVDCLPDNVLVVPWNFPFGSTLIHDYKYLHVGQLNHSRLRFEHVTTFLNFDIDELLVIRDEKIKYLIRNTPCVRFDGFQVPYVETNNSVYSFSDFKLRQSTPFKNQKKYSFNRKKVVANKVHDVVLDQSEAKLNRSKFVRNVKILEAYFLHYTAITTDWKSETSDIDRTSRFTPCPTKDIENLVLDEYIQY